MERLNLPRRMSSIKENRFVHFLRTDFKKSLLFVGLLMVYLSGKAYQKLSRRKHFPAFLSENLSPKLRKLYAKSVSKLDHEEENTIKRISLIELALRNMQYKKTRTLITIGGMSVGIGAIVFLVSLGYGVQQLVVSRVARLEELKQADISPLPGGKFKIDDKALANFKQLQHVQHVLPLITVVGKINFNNSISDVAAYGVTRDYLVESAVKPTHGTIFQSNDIARLVNPSQDVAGASTKVATASFDSKKGLINYSIDPGEWIRVRGTPTTSGTVLGYTKRTSTASQGEEYYGGKYASEDQVGDVAVDEDGTHLGLWVKDELLLWQKQSCDPIKGDCESGQYTVLRDSGGQQVKKEGYFAEVNITSSSEQDLVAKEVLGTATESASVDTNSVDSQDSSLLASTGTVSIDQLSSSSAKPNTIKEVELGTGAAKEAVVNLAMLKILGIKENSAVGKTFTVSFVATGDLIDNKTVKSAPTDYTIVGVIPDNETPVFYVPFLDLRSMGIASYSQAKLSVDDKNSLPIVRKQISALGFTSSSVADTVSQINSLFSTIRTVLAMLGTIALIVAALGMFNTLTVSLLERTREVGLMKAMGMKSEEVRELFLTESMIMGFFGGLMGLFVGFIAGKIVGVIISIIAITKGLGFLDVSYIPLTFIIFIIAISFVVGLLTGVYPARRATKISALNALRYE